MPAPFLLPAIDSHFVLMANAGRRWPTRRMRGACETCVALKPSEALTPALSHGDVEREIEATWWEREQ